MVNIVVPEVGESIVDARVARWLKKAGDTVAAGEPVVELETDKVDVEVAAPRAGVIATIAHGDGADVKIGDVLGTIDGNPGVESTGSAGVKGAGSTGLESTGSAGVKGAGSTGVESAGSAGVEGAGSRGVKGAGSAGVKGAGSTGVSSAGSPDATSAGSSDAKNAGAPSSKPNGSGAVAATPSARKTAREKDVELAAVKTEGPRVTKADVERSVTPARPAASPAPAPTLPNQSSQSNLPNPSNRAEERVRMSKRRATIAKRLVEAQQTAAMLTTFNEVDMSAVMALRERRKEAFKAKHGVSLGVASFFVKATIAALREFPRLNAEIQGDEMVLKHYYDIGVAVGAAEGLVVPVLRDADRMSFAEIESGIRAFAKKAETGTLTLDDLRGGTFSVTNGGVFGSLMSTPILNPPQVGILGLHAIKDRPIGVGGQVVLRPMMYTALTYDHRIVDGSEAVRFLVRIKELVEDPGSLLVES